VVVATGDGAYRVIEVQPEGGASVPAATLLKTGCFRKES